jgi:hypothetical protein
MISPVVEHGFVIVRPNGRLLDKHLYQDRAAADHMVTTLYPGHIVKPARRVTSWRKSGGMTLTTRQPEIIIDEVKA